MRKIGLLTILWFIAVNDLGAQLVNVDSIKQVLYSAKDDTTRVSVMKDVAVRYTYRYPDSALKYIQKALLLAKKIKSDKWTASTSNTYGTILYVMGNYPLSLQYNFSALRIAEKLKDNELLSNVYSGLSNAYREGGDYNNAIYYAHKVRNISENNFTNQLHNTYKLLGSIYEKFNYLDSAFFYIQQSYKFLRINKRPMTWASLPYIIGNIYAKKSNYRLALNNYRTGYKFALQDKLNINLMELCNGLAETFVKTGQTDSAIYYSRQTLLIGQSTAYPIAIFKASSLLADIYKAKHAIDSLVKYTDLATATKDSLFNQQKVTEVQNISFNEKLHQQEIEAREIQYKNKVRFYALLLALAVFILAGILLWRNNQQKQKANALLLHQKQETELQKAKVEQAYVELQAAQAQLIQSEKMASLGALTAGIAHEIQNPLDLVNNFSEVSVEMLIEMKGELDNGNKAEAAAITEEVIQNLEKVIHHGKRADAIVKGMLQHSRANTGKKEPTDINALADEYLRLSYSGLRAKDKSFNATIETHFDESIGKIEVIPQDIGRVLLNLINNAFYAVTQKKKAADQKGENYEPTVSVSTRKKDDRIEIRVKDNGIGIPQKAVDKIFQPFFTTKPTGQGTGLGLSLSYDIIKAHGAEIKVESKEGEGTEFIISLPMQIP